MRDIRHATTTNLTAMYLPVDHSLPEVRHRSLQNLFFKVTHGLSKQAVEVSYSMSSRLAQPVAKSSTYMCCSG